MSDFKAKMHQIRFRLKLCPYPGTEGKGRNGRKGRRGEGREERGGTIPPP